MTMLSPMSDHSSSSSARMTGHIGGCVLETVSSSSEEEEEGNDQFDETSLKGESGSVVVAAMDISQRSSRGRGRIEGRGPIGMEDADHSQSSSSSSSVSSLGGGGFGGMDASLRSQNGMPDTSMRAMEKDTHEDLSYIFRNTIFARGSSLLAGGGGSTGNLMGMDRSSRSQSRRRRRSSFSSVVTTASRQSMSDRGIPLTKNRPKQPINPSVALLCDNNLTSRQKQRRSSHKFSSSSSSGGLLGKVGSILFGGSGNRRTSSQTQQQQQQQQQQQPHDFTKNESWQLQQQNPLRQSGKGNSKRILRGL